MKKIIFYFALVGLLFLGSCFDDKGNYDYAEPFTITISGFEDSYELDAFVESITVSPKIEPADREYECFWGVYPKNIWDPKIDTLGFTRDVDYLIDVEPGEHVFVYVAKDKETGINNILEIDLTVQTALTRGWYLLKEQGGMTDFDLHNDKGIIKNVIASSNDGQQLVGSPVGMKFLIDYYGTWTEDANGGGKWTQTTVLFTLSSEDIGVIKLFNGERIRDFDGVFFMPPTTKKPHSVFKGDQSLHLINNGLSYGITNQLSNQGRFGEPLAANFQYDLSEYRLTGTYVLVYPGLGTFIIPFPPIFYDKLSSSFVSMSYNNIFKLNNNGTYPVANLNSDLLFTTQNSHTTGFVMLKNKSNGTYDFRKINTLGADGASLTLGTYSIDDTYQITKGRFWTALYNNDVIFYEYNGDIYSCNLARGSIDTKLVTKHGAGEEVTFMQHLSSDIIEKLAIATYKDGKYKVYLYDILSGIIDSSKEVIILEGEGKIAGAIHVDGNTATETY